MRRIDRKITDSAQIEKLLGDTMFCTVSFQTEEGYPYSVPLSYGFTVENERLTLYFHCAKEGRKITLMERDNRVAFAIAEQGELIKGETPCTYSTHFYSILGYGDLRKVTDVGEKELALCKIMRHYDQEIKLQFNQSSIDHVSVLALDVISFTAKGQFKKQ